MTMQQVSIERLREVLRYVPETGLFLWIKPPKNHTRLQEYVAGGIASGYVMIKIDGRKYKAHRLAWLYVHGDWPNGDLDHINGCPLDNRIGNLRIASNAQNQANRTRDRNKSTPKGVRSLPSGKFQARISVNHRQIILGTFNSSTAAQAAYLQAAREHYGEFARAS